MNSSTTIDTQAREWFVRLDAPDASEADWLLFQDWLEADERHRDAYDQVEALWIAVEDIPASSLPANENFGVRRRPAWLAPAMGIAAAVVLALGVGSLFLGQDVQTYSTTSQPRTLQLADGSTVYLNRHSEMSVRLRPDRREVTLADGEAAFDVSHDAERPFVITASGRSVNVLGTAFNVINHDGRFSVSVQRGVVSVKPSNNRGVVRLQAGQRIDQKGDGAAVLSRVDPAGASAWRNGLLVYRGSLLTEVGDDLSRYLNKPVKVAPSARVLRFSGVLRVGDEAVLLEQLQDLVPVDVDRSSDGVELTARGAD